MVGMDSFELLYVVASCTTAGIFKRRKHFARLVGDMFMCDIDPVGDDCENLYAMHNLT